MDKEKENKIRKDAEVKIKREKVQDVVEKIMKKYMLNNQRLLNELGEKIWDIAILSKEFKKNS